MDNEKKMKRGTEKKIKITTTFKKNTLEKLDSRLDGAGVTRSYGLDFIVNHFLENDKSPVID